MTERDDINEVAAEYVLATLSREDVLTRRAHRWRSAALTMTTLAAALLGVVVRRDYERRLMPTPYVVVLQAGKTPPADWHTDDRSNFDPGARVPAGLSQPRDCVDDLVYRRGSDYGFFGALYSRSPGLCA